MSGLLVRHGWPLALMLCADRVPIVSTHFRVRRPKRALPIPGNDRICITSSCPRQSVCSVHAASNSVGSLYLSLRTMMAQAIRAIFWRAVDHEGEVLEKLTRISPSAPAGKPSTPYASLFSCSTRTYRQWSQWCVSVYTTRADLPLFSRSSIPTRHGGSFWTARNAEPVDPAIDNPPQWC